MFIHASDPDRIKKELGLLAAQLHELTRQVHLLSNNLVTTTPRGKQTLPALFIREVDRQMALGVPEADAVEDARDALEMTNEAATFCWSRAKSHRRGLDQYAKIYCCQLLRDKGFTRSNICKIVDISTGNLQEYLHKDLGK